MLRVLLATLLAAACLTLPAAASAQDALVVPDPAADQVTALGGTIVWVSGTFGSQRILQRAPDGVIGPVENAPQARSYSSIDLGKDSDGKLRLTYLRCDASSSCKSLWDDLDGRRATFRNLEAPGCKVNTGVSQWRARVAYGLFCTGSAANRKLTGLYTKNGSRRPVRLPRPRDAVKFRIDTIASVDLRGERVAAVVADVYEYSFSQTVGGRDMRSFMAAASEGDSDEHARGLAIQGASTHWTLTDSTHAGDPNTTYIFRQSGGCIQRELLVSASNATHEFEATDLAVDGKTLYLLKPGAGIATHTFTPDPTRPC
ncbi:MAG TPA: hypothetical protein VNA28_15680 [Solirubrobacteraceae bacterium]|nr:hypothetical protein [Solirubrobacteraceae bacterium]